MAAEGIPEIGKVLGGLDNTRKPLAKLIPRLNELRDDPVKVLGEREFEIKVSPPYGVCTFICLFGPGLLVIPFFDYVLRWNPHGPESGLIFLTWLLGSALVGVFIGQFISRGKLIFRLTGLEIHDRHSHVFCPWSLFCIQGAVEISQKSEIVLPIQSMAVPFIEYHRNDEIIKTGPIQNAHFRLSKNQQQAILKDHYLAKGPKLGQLILELGQKLGAKNSERGRLIEPK